jgi:hypothetical protein
VRSNGFSTPAKLALLLAAAINAQDSQVLTIAPVPKVSVQRGGEVATKLSVEIRSGYHVNSNAPDDEFLIPLRLTWNKGPLEVVEVRYPQPAHEKYSFSEKPLSVFSGKFEIATRFKVSPAAGDMGVMTGKLRYQACNDHECLQPKTVNVQFSLDVR